LIQFDRGGDVRSREITMQTQPLWRCFIVLALFLSLAVAAGAPPTEAASAPDDFGGGPIEPPQDLTTEAELAAIRAQVAYNIAMLTFSGQISMQAAEAVSFQFPVRAADALTDFSFYGVSGFMDHNPAISSSASSLQDYMCGTRTYDISGYNHQGTDYFTFPFPWLKMDESLVEIVAAAPGTLVFKRDGGYDRQCAMTGALSNAVVIRHADGTLAHYLHMKKGSVTTKGVGAAIAAGEYLGIVGSSGSSTGPHLHFEVRDADNNVVDPFEGPCNDRPSMWAAQAPYYDSAIVALHTGSAPPVRPPCPQQETPNIQETFDPGDEVTFVATYRDQLAGQTGTYRILRPDGSVYDSWTHASTAPHYSASYWYWRRTLGGDVPAGAWRFEVDFEDETYGIIFYVQGNGAVPTVTPSPTPTFTPTPTPTPASQTLTVTHPLDGMSLQPGETLNILWTYEDREAEVRIDLYAGDALARQIATNTRNDGLYFWPTSSDLAPRRDYAVRVSLAETPADFDLSDPFTIAPAPTADFTLAPATGPHPLTVAFSDASTSLVDAWRWAFGDGVTSTAQQPTHTYTRTGAYAVSLAVTGPTGSDHVTRTRAVTVTLPPLTADFSAVPLQGQAPLTVAFTAQILGPLIHQRLWEFGDGATSTLSNPTHVYAQNGAYTVTLTVSTPDEEDQLLRPAYIRVFDRSEVFLPTVLR
jgi:PKD repeat protein/murein DD-endopeptidase MepM/ murein hydrolase activator NlpD